MLKKVVIGTVFISLLIAGVACSSTSTKPAPDPTPKSTPAPTSKSTPAPNPKPAPEPELTFGPNPSGRIKAAWIEPEVDGGTVSIPVSKIADNWNTHFKLNIQGSTENFMAYIFDGKIYVRANVCPPCRSIGFSLEKDFLICDRCATTFKAKTGAGIQGACVDFPKASVPYKINDGNVVMKETDLATAYQDTIKPG